MNPIELCKQKTILIKKYPSLRYSLEKGLVESETSAFLRRKKGFPNLVRAFSSDLKKILSENEISKLRLLNIKVPQNGCILLLPFMKRPLVGFNLDNLPYLFRNIGWLFHAMPHQALEACSKSGCLLSPIEMIFENKKYLSEKFYKYLESGRIVDGISFAFQDVGRYQGYVRRLERSQVTGFGGFFIFPLQYVIQEGNILKFGGRDGFPQIDLLDPNQRKFHNLFKTLIVLRDSYEKLIKNFYEIVQLYQVLVRNKDKFLLLNVEYLSKYKSAANKDIFEILVAHLNNGKHKNILSKIISENNFFSFMLLVNGIYSGDRYFTPEYKIFSQRETPTYLNGTIFYDKIYSYLIPDERLNPYCSVGLFLVSRLQKSGNVVSPSVINRAKRLKPKDVLTLIKGTLQDVFKSMEILTIKTRTKFPVKVSLRNGVLFLTKEWYNEHKKSGVLSRLLSRNIPTIIGFRADENYEININEIHAIIHNLIGARDLSIIPGMKTGTGYFSSKGGTESVEVHYINNGNSVRII